MYANTKLTQYLKQTHEHVYRKMQQVCNENNFTEGKFFYETHVPVDISL